MEKVQTFLMSLGLGEYVPLCEQNVHYDHMGCILTYDDDELDILVAHVGTLGMLTGHLFRLKHAGKGGKRTIQMCQL